MTSVMHQVELYFLRENIANDPFLGTARIGPAAGAGGGRLPHHPGTTSHRARLAGGGKSDGIAVSNMGSDMAVPLEVVLELKHVKGLTDSVAVVQEAVQRSSQVRPIAQTKTARRGDRHRDRA